jgi:hypothetical protein
MSINTDVHQHIAWNGALITIPVSWEPHVAGIRHLIFEKDFQPLAEIRWEDGSKYHERNFSTVLKKFKRQSGTRIYNGKPQKQWLPFGNIFKTLCYTSTDDQTIDGGVWFCLKSKTLILFQLFPAKSEKKTAVLSCLSTLSFQDRKQETMWRIQDFSLVTPPLYALSNYTFAPGLTRLSFTVPNVEVQICRLAPADSRLNTQSLNQILQTLTGLSKVPAKIVEENDTCKAHRNPAIWQQILLRLRREKPFVDARLWHDRNCNRLLAVVLSSRRPIPADLVETLCQHYEIIQKKTARTTTDQA